MTDKPVLIYDGKCGFCRAWIKRWHVLTQDRVEYAASQEVSHLYPGIAKDRFYESVVLVDGDSVYYGAEAVFRALATVPRHGIALRLYKRFPLWAKLTEFVYSFVARHRQGFSRLSWLFWGKHVEPSTFWIARRIFLGFLGLIYFFAFASLWVQLDGLYSSTGISPISDYLEALRSRIPQAERIWVIPSIFWFNATDDLIHIICAAGVFLSLLLTAGVARVPVLFLLWLFYLSFCSAGQDFMSFQWDNLLLEVGFLAIFLAPVRLLPSFTKEAPPSAAVMWLFRLLLFKLMFMSGAVKLLSGDTVWRDLTAMTLHYETQPLPTALAWFAHQLPVWMQKVSTAGMFGIELFVPFLLFFPRRPRHLAALLIGALMLIIMATGNYCFFNLLALVLCLLMIDDAFWLRWIPMGLQKTFWRFLNLSTQHEELKHVYLRRAKMTLVVVVVFVVASLDLIQIFAVLNRRQGLAEPITVVLRRIAPFRTVNNYGLFAVMTKRRVEIEVEGSNDGKTWKSYEFKWKPGDLARHPLWNTPHQPRLDWQMWFAALNHYKTQPWFLQFQAHLLKGTQPVLKLLQTNPFPDKPPRYIRSLGYDYHFTTSEERKVSGHWWKRTLLGLYSPVLSLKN